MYACWILLSVQSGRLILSFHGCLEFVCFFTEIPVLMQTIWTAAWQKPTNYLCAQRWLRSAWASVQFDQSSLCTRWVAKDPSFLHVDSEDSDQTGQMPGLIWVFAGRTVILLVLSWSGSIINVNSRIWSVSSLFVKVNSYLWLIWGDTAWRTTLGPTDFTAEPTAWSSSAL